MFLVFLEFNIAEQIWQYQNIKSSLILRFSVIVDQEYLVCFHNSVNYKSMSEIPSSHENVWNKNVYKFPIHSKDKIEVGVYTFN